jgi:hypothetical protein
MYRSILLYGLSSTSDKVLPDCDNSDTDPRKIAYQKGSTLGVILSSH